MKSLLLISGIVLLYVTPNVCQNLNFLKIGSPDLEIMKKAQKEIETNWEDVHRNSIRDYLHHRIPTDSLKVSNFASYDISIRDTFYQKRSSNFTNLIALYDKSRIQYAKAGRNSMVQFIVKTEYRFDKNKALLHIVRFNKDENYDYAAKFITLDSRLFENQLGILHMEKLVDKWSYEIWAYGSY